MSDKSFSYISDNISIESFPFLSISSNPVNNLTNPPYIKGFILLEKSSIHCSVIFFSSFVKVNLLLILLN